MSEQEGGGRAVRARFGNRAVRVMRGRPCATDVREAGRYRRGRETCKDCGKGLRGQAVGTDETVLAATAGTACVKK